MSDKIISLHDQVKGQILRICKNLGFKAKEEYRGKDWRADVFVLANNIKYAFEVQITSQSLNRTLERQKKYKRDNIIGCWLFEREPVKLIDEREDLPSFKIKSVEGQIYVSLKKRKDLPLEIFINDFLQNKIKFCLTVVSKPKQKIDIVFVKMDCWKCGKENHIYFIVSDFLSACNSKIYYQELLWNSDRKKFRPEIIDYINKNVITEKGNTLSIAKIKERYSKTVNDSYLSFGCIKCDSIFGDWFVHEAQIEAIYGGGVIDKITFEIEMNLNLRLKVPHWCHPGKNFFCE